MIKEAAEPYMAEVKANWEQGSQILFARDGTHPIMPRGGHDLKNNPTLRTTLGALAEGYMKFCARKAQLFDENALLSRMLLGHVDTDTPGEELLERGKRFQAEIDEIDKALVRHNSQAFKVLLAEGSGIEQEARRYGDPNAPVDEAIRKTVAKELLAATIGTVVATCKAHLPTPAARNDFVPKRFEGDPTPAAGRT